MLGSFCVESVLLIIYSSSLIEGRVYRLQTAVHSTSEVYRAAVVPSLLLHLLLVGAVANRSWSP